MNYSKDEIKQYVAEEDVKFIRIIRLSAKGTDGVMKPVCFHRKNLFAILSTEVFGILHRPWR